MAYTITLTDGTVFATIADGATNTSSSMTLIGKNYAGYGQFLDDNFIRLLENGADTTAPSSPLTGQLWWDKTNNLLKVYNGTVFKTISAATASASAPSSNVVGDLWYDTTNQQLKVWTGAAFIVVGPAYSASQGTSGAIPETITDSVGATKYITSLYVNNNRVGIVYDSSSFVPQASLLATFPTIYPGITLTTTNSPTFAGTANNASFLNSLTSSQFMRSDANTATTGRLQVNNANGIYIGTGNAVQISQSSNDGVVTAPINGANLVLQANVSGAVHNVARALGSNGTFAIGNAATVGTTLNVTGNTTGGNILTSGQVSATGNITGGNVSTSLVTATTLSATANVQGGNLRTTGLISSTGNITSAANISGTYILGNGSQLTGISAAVSVSKIENGTSKAEISASGGNLAVTIGGTANVVVVDTNTLYTNRLSATGNITGGNVSTSLVTATTLSATANVQGGNLRTAGLISSTGNITSAANVSGGNLLTGGAISATANISGGNLLTGGLISATGNITTAGIFIGTFAGNISGNLTVPGANTQVLYNNNGNAGASAGFTFDSASNIASVAGNVQGGNLRTTGLISATGSITGGSFATGGAISATGNITSVGNISGGNVLGGANVNATTHTGTTVSVSANVTGGNILTGGLVSAAGNVFGNYILGNGSLLTGVITSVANINSGTSNVTVVSSGGNVTVGVGGTGNVAVFHTGGLNVTANVTGGNVLTGGLISSTGNVISGNILTGGEITATGNVTTSGFFIGTFAGNISGNLTVPGLNTQVLYNNNGNAGASAGFTFDSASNAAVISGNVTAANLITAGLVTSTGNVTGGNLRTGGQVSATANITGGNLLTGGLISATSTVTSAANITGGNILTGGIASATGNITGGNIITSGVLQVNGGGGATAIVNGAGNATGNIGSATGYFNRIFAQATTALYADVAERFAADEELDPGTVVELGGQAEITKSRQDLSENVFGVISTNAAYLMNGGAGEDRTHPPVAMTGRVPVQVVGQVRKGDRLVSAGNGMARSARLGEATAFNVIGRALRDKHDDAPGTVEAIVTIK